MIYTVHMDPMTSRRTSRAIAANQDGYSFVGCDVSISGASFTFTCPVAANTFAAQHGAHVIANSGSSR